MYKNRSPNLIIIIIFLYSLVMPVDTSRAITNQTESEEPLTIEVCKKLLEEIEVETNSLDDPVLLEKKKACEILIEQTEPEITNEEEEASTPDTESPEEPNENEVILPPDSKKDEPVVPSTPESDIPMTPESPTPESDIPASKEDIPKHSNESDLPEPPASENEESPIAEPSSSEDQLNEEQNQLPSEDTESSLEELPVAEAPKKETPSQRPVVSPRLAGVALLGNSSLSATYNATTQTIELVNTVSSLLNVNLTSGYMIFRLPPEVMQSIETDSIQLQYRYSGLLGIGTRTVDVVPVIDRTNNQIYADVSSLLKLSVLSSDRFTLSFKVGKLPVGLDKIYTFNSALTDGLIDLNVLSGNTATATLGIGPTFRLTVPPTLDFGSHELTGRETIIARLAPMTISIAHENATGYNWRLQASLTRPMTSTEGDILEDVLYFKISTQKQLLQATEIEVATGQMTANQNQSPLVYAKEEGIILDLTGKQATPSTYSADIQWNLINAP
ncbi:hypothetical protein [Exiguobacterium undae]|uniref:WxL domain-containing protein n=1 Tax=Exiguobacterium undae TaxID=169177 RepID=A0ABX2V8A7_9BACL|nr:hypothetical protein [Exiguobacterium undae]OAN12784.1 hypothetical protein A3783_10720 [Exiguobacterium undae]